jgi:hypothetical protein
MRFLEGFSVVIIVIFFLWILIFVGVGIVTENGCLKAGYRNYNVSGAYNRFCSYRKDQTDIVIPFHQAITNPLTGE